MVMLQVIEWLASALGGLQSSQCVPQTRQLHLQQLRLTPDNDGCAREVMPTLRRSCCRDSQQTDEEDAPVAADTSGPKLLLFAHHKCDSCVQWLVHCGVSICRCTSLSNLAL